MSLDKLPARPTRLVTTVWAVVGLLFCVLILFSALFVGIAKGTGIELGEGFMVLFGSTATAFLMVLTTKGYYQTGRLALGVISLSIMLLLVAALSVLPLLFTVEMTIPEPVLGFFGVAVIGLHNLLKPT